MKTGEHLVFRVIYRLTDVAGYPQKLHWQQRKIGAASRASLRCSEGLSNPNSEAVAFKFDCAILKGVLTQDAATNGIYNVHCNFQQCIDPDLIL